MHLSLHQCPLPGQTRNQRHYPAGWNHVPSLTLAQHPDPECAVKEFREIKNAYGRKTAGERL